jgi:hypothetical protein
MQTQRSRKRAFFPRGVEKAGWSSLNIHRWRGSSVGAGSLRERMRNGGISRHKATPTIRTAWLPDGAYSDQGDSRSVAEGRMKDERTVSEGPTKGRGSRTDKSNRMGQTKASTDADLNGSATLGQGVHGCLLERSAHVTGVAVGEVRPLDHQEVGYTFNGIDPGLGAPGAAVAEGAG